MTTQQTTQSLATLAILLTASPTLAPAQFVTPLAPRFSIVTSPSAPLTHMAVDSIADLNADGTRDILVGMSELDRVEVRSGANGALLATISGVPILGSASTQFGFDVAATGDIDGDGREEIIIGAPSAPPRGAVAVISFTGGGAFTVLRLFGPTAASHATLPSGTYGHTVGRVGDLNNDGRQEIAVGAPLWTPPNTAVPAQGMVEILNLVFAVPVVTRTLVGPIGGQRLGQSLTRLTDLNGDGFDELAVGSTNQSVQPPFQPVGIANVFHGASLTGAGPAVILGTCAGAFTNDLFGWSMSNVPDVNGDGFEDLLVGAPDSVFGATPNVQMFSGAALAVGGLPAVPPLYMVQGTGRFGMAVSSTGDFNNDRVRDFMVGAAFQPTGIGQAFVHIGTTGASFHALVPPPLPVGPFTNETFGFDVSELSPGRKSMLVANPSGGLVAVY